ncbi:DUF6527 family protein [Zunongwangia atlantica]|uniref:Uncharacterized protein n=1 Tax=Zunongwangia atlantica 22II14-10F7 TaxID=1185767 RepID=A0A1Y1T490_9FLAO|nr:DUF6527 family protein [Zunongwangia atlantica]ORL45263.1 hypothetical protein IIF7_12447 [Zunongwangia atlantica 22II14-10F7]
MPKIIDEGVLYISPEYRAVIHKCACGCGEKVHTPLAPTNWKLIYDGKQTSLEPSIGNWSFDCRSHYWIINSEIIWAESWSNHQVFEKRKRDRQETIEYFKSHGNKNKSHSKVTNKERNWLWIKILNFFK